MSKKMDKTLSKCEQLIVKLNELKKAVENIETGGSSNVQSSRKPVSALGVGWSHDPGTGELHHSTHGIISAGKQADGSFKPVHGGKRLGTFSNAGDAGRAMGTHARGLTGADTGMHNRPSPNMPSPTKMGAPAVKGEDAEKSDYGKFKGGSQYDPAANAKRKMNNVGTERLGNQSVKSYTHGKAFANKVPKGAAGPAKQYTPEQIAAINEARKLKKNSEEQPWDRHAGVPNADAELAKVQATNPVNKAEDLMANQLANVMAGRSMLGIKPPPQPTDEQMFGHLVPSEEEIQKAEASWNNKMNWLQEAVKPISARFNSPEEEEQYWNSIKIADRDDGKPGY